MEDLTKDTPCNNGPFSFNIRIQYEVNRIVQPLMKRIEQLEKKVRVMGSMKSMGHWDPIHPSAACKPAAAAAASCPQVNFVSSQMGTLQKILESNGIYGPPPIQPIHNSRLRAGLRSLCKYNFDRKDYQNQETKMKQNEILAKSTMAMFTKSTKKMERKPDENANANGSADAISISTVITTSEAEPAPLALFVNKTAPSENSSAKLIGNTNAAMVSAGIKPREVKLAPLLDGTASCEDVYFEASDKKMPSEDIPATIDAPAAAAATVAPEKTNEINSEEKLVPTCVRNGAV
jgi:hypothetical protein